MTNVLSPDILPVEELRSMLRHIKLELPSIMHLPISLDDTLHFYWYLKTHMLVANGQFLLLTDVSLQGRAQQLQIYEIFNLPVSHSDVSAQYKIYNKYIGITYDETQAVMITKQQYSTCLHANGQFCKIGAPYSSSLKPTIMHNGPIHQEWPGTGSTAFPNYISYTTCIPSYCNHIKPVDIHFNTCHARISH